MAQKPPHERPRRPAASDRRAPNLRRRAAHLQRELGDLLFALIEEKRAAGVVSHVPDRFALELRLELFSRENLEAPPDQLHERLREAVEKWVRRTASFPLGHVYSYWEQSFSSPDTVPPGPREVFAGYSSTGEPIWREYAAVLLERRDPRVEYLFGKPPSPVTITQRANELNERQLGVYGKHSPTFRLLGQVTVGYLPLVHRGDSNAGVAVSFQAVELAGSRLELNIVGCLPDGRPAFEALEAAADPRLTDALRATRRNLVELGLRRFPRRRRQTERRRHALRILSTLSKQLDRVYRQKKRRTRHSEDRHRDRRRPTASALSDAQRAADDAIYRDVAERTWVVVGPKNRVHVFNDLGEHVTSVVYAGESVKQRTTRGKWLRPRPEELARFRVVLERSR